MNCYRQFQAYRLIGGNLRIYVIDRKNGTLKALNVDEIVLKRNGNGGNK